MNTFPKDFLLGTATAAHQVEGNNIHSENPVGRRWITTTYIGRTLP